MMKFFIVTPSYNNGENILESLLSVYNQTGDFSIEHIVVDGGSRDSTLGVLEMFEKEYGRKKDGYTFRYVSKPDEGMYDAILNGFSMGLGDIMAWINTDDLYQENAFQTIVDILAHNPEIKWIKGVTDYLERDGSKRRGKFLTYRQRLIQKGIYGTVGPFIQQDSVFWKRELWEMVNYEELRVYRYAGDFRLWQLFSMKEPIYTFDKSVSYFRKRENQKSLEFSYYLDECLKTTKIMKIEKLIYAIIFKVEKLFKVKIVKGFSINVN